MPWIHSLTRCPSGWRLAVLLGSALTLTFAAQPQPGSTQEVEQLAAMSLDSLLNIRVSVASRYEQVTRTAPASTVIITAEAIRQHRYQTLAEVLEDVPGFYTSNDRNYTYIGVRGFSRPTDYNNRILVLLDGQQLNEGYYNSTYAGHELGIDLRTLSRIEIVRGPGSAMFGTSAMLAVINLIPARAETDGGWVSGRLASFGTRALSAGYGLNLSGLEILVAGSATERDGSDLYYAEYDVPGTNNGIAERLDWERSRTAFATARLAPLSVQLRWSTRDKGLPTGAWDAAFNDSRAQTTDDFASADVKLDLPLAPDKQLALRARTDMYDYSGVYPQEDASYDDFNEVRSSGVEGMFTWDQATYHRLVVGAEADWYTRATYTERYDDEAYSHHDIPYQSYSLFAQSELHLGSRLVAYLGLRNDWSGDVKPALSPRLALIFAPDGLTNFKLLWGRAFRTPNVYEREGFATTSQDVAVLDPEFIHTAELVLERRLAPSVIASASLFHTTMKGLIDLAADEDSATYFRNVQSVRSLGAEAELIWRTGETELRGSYSFADTEDSSTGIELTNSPRHLVKARLGTSLLDVALLGVSGRCESGRGTVQETRTESHCTTNATLTYAPAQRLELSLQLRNPFDHRYANPAGWEHRQAAIGQDGRSIGIEAQWRF